MARYLSTSPAAISSACAWDTGAVVQRCAGSDCTGCLNNPWREFMGLATPGASTVEAGPAITVLAVVRAARREPTPAAAPRRRLPVLPLARCA